MSNDLIEKRNERTKKRKQVKRKMDSIIGLSFHDKDKRVMSVSADLKKLSDSKARLIDEGYIDNGFVIKKGTLEKYINGKNQYVRGWEFNGEKWEQTKVLNLTSDFVGTVNLGHMDFSVMPFILGKWTKDDLTLVDTENDRQALDVTLHLDEESVFIKELKRQEHDIGISAEFWVHQNDEDTRSLSELLGYYMPVFDEIYIFAYGLVGECGNVNSSGLELNKENDMPNKNIDNMFETVAEDEAVQLDAENELEIVPTDNNANEPVDNDTEGELAEEQPQTDESEEGIAEEDGEENLAVDESENDEADGLAEVLSMVSNLKSEINTLNTTIDTLNTTIKALSEANAELKKSNRKLQNKLKSEIKKKETFLESAKDIAVELLPNEDKKKEEVQKETIDRNYYYNDGIGEL